MRIYVEIIYRIAPNNRDPVSPVLDPDQVRYYDKHYKVDGANLT